MADNNTNYCLTLFSHYNCLLNTTLNTSIWHIQLSNNSLHALKSLFPNIWLFRRIWQSQKAVHRFVLSVKMGLFMEKYLVQISTGAGTPLRLHGPKPARFG